MNTQPQKPDEYPSKLAMQVTDIIFNREEGWSTKLEKVLAQEIEKAEQRVREEERKRIERIVLSIDKPCLCSPLHAKPCCAFYRQFSVFREDVLRGVRLSTPKD